MDKAIVIRKNQAPVNQAPWGSMQWLVNGETAPGTTMTLGRVTLRPGQGNPLHAHPNSQEILFVARGAVEHRLPGGGTVRLEEGDCILLPQGGAHRAVNAGPGEAEVIVAFNTPERRTEDAG